VRIVQVAYPLAPVGPDAVGGAEQVLAAVDAAATAGGHASVVVAAEGSRCAGELVAIPRPDGLLDDEAKRRAREAVRAAVERLTPGADLVHLHGVDFASYVPPPGPPVLVTLHLPRAWYADDALRPARPATYLHCVSAAQHREFEGAAAPLLPPIANGVDLERFRPRGRKRGFALAMGRISPEKGFHLALLAARRAGVPLVLAGRVFPYAEHVRHFEHDVAPLLDGRAGRFLGPVGGARKRRLLAGARCLVAPSLSAETASLAAIEALAAGTPVIAFPAGALAEVVEHGRTGFLVQTVEEMADAITAAGGLRADACRAAAEARFDAREMVARYLEVYERLAGSGMGTARRSARSGAPRFAARDVPAQGDRTPPATSRSAPDSPGLRLEVLAASDLPRLEPAWRELWHACASATPFQRPEWLIPWYAHLSYGGGLALAARLGRELVGLAPLHRWEERGRRLVGLAGGPISDYRDALAADPVRERVAAALLARVARGDLADAAVLDDLAPGALLLRGEAPPAVRDAIEPAQTCPELPLDGGSEAIWSRFAPRHAQNLRYERRRLARGAAVRHELADRASVQPLLASLAVLHSRRWAARGQPGVLASTPVARFHAESAPRLLDAGLLRLHALRVDGEVAAVAHVLVTQRRAHLYLVGFDPRHGRRSPGALLCAHAIEAAASEGCLAFDFLRGDEPYKRAFGGRARTTWRRRLAPGPVEARDAVPTVGSQEV
jgi:CelD/BcsL family acetyltransferase involved in cellulose biosynthesis/glycosyltransferase involved in cell wall biosynthesis